MAKSPKAEVEEAVEVVKQPAGKNKLVIVAVTALFLGGGGAIGAWLMLADKHSAQDEGRAKPAKVAKKEGPPVFLALESFVVNLRSQASGSSEHYLQTDMTLRLAGPEVADQVKQHMPEVRSRVLLLLSTRTSQELLTPEGKTRLAEAVRVAITALVEPDAVQVEQPKIGKEAAEGDKGDEPSEEASAEEASAEGDSAEQAEVAGKAAEEPRSPEDSKVKSVLFTSFIIQ